jgi:hypothetical protein
VQGFASEQIPGKVMSKQTRVSHPIYKLLPTEVEGFDSLAELVLDMRWSWNDATDGVWRTLDPILMATHEALVEILELEFLTASISCLLPCSIEKHPRNNRLHAASLNSHCSLSLHSPCIKPAQNKVIELITSTTFSSDNLFRPLKIQQLRVPDIYTLQRHVNCLFHLCS